MVAGIALVRRTGIVDRLAAKAKSVVVGHGRPRPHGVRGGDGFSHGERGSAPTCAPVKVFQAGAECHGNAPGREGKRLRGPSGLPLRGEGLQCMNTVAERKQEKGILLLTPAHHGLVLFGCKGASPAVGPDLPKARRQMPMHT